MLALQSATAVLLAVGLAALAGPTARQRAEARWLAALVAVLLALVVGGMARAPWPSMVAGFAAVPVLAARVVVPVGGRAAVAHALGPIAVVALAGSIGSTGVPVALGVLALGIGYGAWAVRRWRAGERPPALGVALAVFAVHWVLSMASWLAFALGAPAGLARAAEVGSLVTRGGFGATVAALGVRHLPALAPSPPAPYADGLGTPDRDRLAERLRRLVAEERPHLDPGLSAAALAERLGASPRELSEILTVAFESSFYDFVNGLRVEEATAALADPARADDTILEILYASGFNSKSAFHRAFRARVGQTPSAYRRAALAAGEPGSGGRAGGDGQAGDSRQAPLPALGRRAKAGG